MFYLNKNIFSNLLFHLYFHITALPCGILYQAVYQLHKVGKIVAVSDNTMGLYARGLRQVFVTEELKFDYYLIGVHPYSI